MHTRTVEKHALAAYHTSPGCKCLSAHLIGGALGSVCSASMLSTTCWHVRTVWRRCEGWMVDSAGEVESDGGVVKTQIPQYSVGIIKDAWTWCICATHTVWLCCPMAVLATHGLVSVFKSPTVWVDILLHQGRLRRWPCPPLLQRQPTSQQPVSSIYMHTRTYELTRRR